MTIRREVVSGAEATVAYLDAEFVPTVPEAAAQAKIIWDDGRVAFFTFLHEPVVKFNPHHDEHGRFARSGMSGIKTMTTPVPEGQRPLGSVARRLRTAVDPPGGGITLDWHGEAIQSGIAVGVFPLHSLHYAAGTIPKLVELRNWLTHHRAKLTQGLRIGGWHDEGTGERWIDLIRVYPQSMRSLAVRMGRLRNQRSVADLDAITRKDWANALIPTGGTGLAKAGRGLRLVIFGPEVTAEEILDALWPEPVAKFNPHHDAKGRFARASGGGGALTSAALTGEMGRRRLSGKMLWEALNERHAANTADLSFYVENELVQSEAEEFRSADFAHYVSLRSRLPLLPPEAVAQKVGIRREDVRVAEEHMKGLLDDLRKEATPLKEATVLYRTTLGLEKVKVGQVMEHSGPMSTSTEVKFSTHTGGPRILRLRVPKGIRVVTPPNLLYENEVILPVGTRFLVRRVHRRVQSGSGVRYPVIQADVLPPRKRRVGKANPYHDTGGKFTSKERAVTPGQARAGLQAMVKLAPADRIKQYEGEEHRALRDAIADAPRRVPARIKALVSNADDWSQDSQADFLAAATQRAKRWAAEGVIPKDQAEPLARFGADLHSDLLQAGASAESARGLAQKAVDHLAAQESEALGRSLGDHGIRHLTTDSAISVEALRALPGGEENSPGNRALLRMAGAFHDVGYLTPSSRLFLDTDHPEWSRQHYEANLKGLVTEALGTKQAALLEKIIATHSDSDFDFRTPGERIASAFRTADNIALFHAEKLPGMLRYVPSNVRVLERLSKGELTPVQAKIEMRQNLAKVAMPDRMRRQLDHAIGEVSPVLPKFTLGMYGGRYHQMNWDGAGLNVQINRTGKSKLLERYSDLGFRQFQKLYRTYYPADKRGAAGVAQGVGFTMRDPKSGSTLRFTFLGGTP